METIADDMVIRLEGIWKCYGLLPALKDRWRAFRNGDGLPDDHGHWALRDISLEMQQGEILGIIGRNGAGKSTLLKVLAGVTPVTRGRFEIRGRVFPMIELSAGLHPELTGQENVYLLGAVMGLTRDEVTAKIREIEAFCELGEWFGRPVRQYSSGMLARLGFGVAVNVDADILLVDEVLGVGDLGFRNKCLRRMEAMHSAGRSVLLVSHNTHLVRRMCDKVMVLEKGETVFFGHPEKAAECYEEILRSSSANKPDGHGAFDFVGTRLEQAQLLGGNGELVESFPSGAEVVLEFSLLTDQNLGKVKLNVVIESIEAIPVVWESLDVPCLEPGRHHFRLHWHDLRLKAGLYPIRIGMGVGTFPVKAFRVTNALQLHIGGDVLKRGLYVPRSEFTHIFRHNELT
jgi:lipopolysaccharide transport system ATP-binding protein